MTETLDGAEDIRKLEKENEYLRTELMQQKMLLNKTLDAIFIFDQHLNIIQANEATCRLVQTSKEDLLNKSVLDFLYGIPKDKIECSLDLFFRKGTLRREISIQLENGETKYIEFVAEHDVLNQQYIVVMRDISSKKILERERSMNEQLFKDLFDRAIDGMVIFDQDGCIIDANHSFCQSFELQKTDLTDRYLKEFVEDENLPALQHLLTSLKETGKAKGELPVTLQSGQYKLFELTITSNVMSGFYMSIMRDITEKRLMEEKLLKSEERFREIFENAMDAIIIWADDGEIVRANESACRIFELPMHSLIGKKLTDFLVKSDRRYRPTRRRYIRNHEIREELLFRMANGQFKELEFTSKHAVLEGQHLTILRNVSDRKRMEEELRESELKFRKVFNGSMDGIVLFDNQYHIIEVNPSASELLGLKDDHLTEMNLFHILAPYQIEHLAQPAQTMSLDEMDNEVPFVLNHPDQRILEFSFKRNIIHNMNLAIFRDVTERKELEERVRKSDTLHVVGELAAGIAHEIRNPMTALKGFIQLLKGNIEGEYSLYFNVITSELKRIESIITEFLILAKPQAIVYEEKNVVQIVKDTMDLLHAQANLGNVQMHLNVMDEIPLIYCEQNQLKQVFINILKNAIEVMPRKGNVYVSIQRKGEEHIVISLRDEGCGMAEDKLKRLGEPFYTTKERGTGLGLMVSYKIIEEHQGTIEVESEEGVGTVFHLTLPLRQKKQEGEH
ncbi:PAS domain S-box protein [Bacillus pumilus]|uniref:PAS domain-containing sensor histidine kinase n=1 Tax=Bacillus TaxID=1386 RepID=UPI00071781AB|nr:PAS domain-containing sensor histidine kinase [Bacillus pumilus]AMM97013.1 sporulation kinase [Bacillus pumilus]KRU16969.1 PAS domain-containing sensor histidine kinase [Bacillus pumilus]MCY7679433.1 PAS domain S-box protein [Bacillus pumilus]MDH3151074.1 PAS domain S-box protein [Bacillus pumilus]QLI78601.1 PAS domain S-box protein [Bacillus pumilus]